MGRGYGLLWRKFFDHPLWQEVRIFSKAEAWIDIVFCLARGTDDNQSQLKRGEFRASLTWLASRWNWDKAKVYRFMAFLTSTADPMLLKVGSPGPDIRAYRVINYDRYQNPRSGPRETLTEPPTEPHNEPPSEPLKPASIVGSPLTGEPPGEPPNEPVSEPKVNKRINTGEKNPTSADTRHRAFVQFLHEHFPRVTLQPADYKALKEMLLATKTKPGYALCDLEMCWYAFVGSRDQFDRQQGLSVRYFCRRLPRFAAMVGERPTELLDFHHKPEFVAAKHVCTYCEKQHEHDDDCDDFNCSFGKEKPCRAYLRKHQEARSSVRQT